MDNKFSKVAMVLFLAMILSSFMSIPNLYFGEILTGGGDWLVDNRDNDEGGKDSRDCMESPDQLTFEFGFNYKPVPKPEWESSQYIESFIYEVYDCETKEPINNRGMDGSSYYTSWYHYDPNSYIPENPEYQGMDITWGETITLMEDLSDDCDSEENAGKSSINVNLCVKIIPVHWSGPSRETFEIKGTFKICCDDEPRGPIEHDYEILDFRESAGVNSDFQVTPNPFFEVINIKGSFEPYDDVRIFDSKGTLVYNQKTITAISNLRIQTESMPSGIYYVKVYREKSNFDVQRIFKF